MKSTPLLALALVAILLLSSCAGSAADTTTSATDPVVTSTTFAAPMTSGPTTTAASTSTTVSINFDDASVFVAELSGAEVVPAVDTLAAGSAIFKIDKTGTRGYFKLVLSEIRDVIASRVHEGKPGANGQGLLILYPGPTVDGPFSGALAQGYFDSSVLIGSLTRRSLAEFAVLLQGGRAYVNVGTVQNPKGEIRGQIREETSAAGALTE